MNSLATNMQRTTACTAPTRAMCSPIMAQRVSRRSLQVVRTQEKTKESESNSNLSQEQLNEIGKTKVGDISPAKAELRADMGNGMTDLLQMQAFDGPAPETINGRTAMLGLMIALAIESSTGLGLKEQIADHPAAVIASVVVFTAATYAPLIKGITRKEAYENGVWTAKAENQNGRFAMMGFLGMVITEAVSGGTTLHALGLQ